MNVVRHAPLHRGLVGRGRAGPLIAPRQSVQKVVGGCRVGRRLSLDAALRRMVGR